MGDIESGQSYRHYKGNEYVIYAIAKDEETGDLRVVYYKRGVKEKDILAPNYSLGVYILGLVAIATDTETLEKRLILRSPMTSDLKSQRISYCPSPEFKEILNLVDVNKIQSEMWDRPMSMFVGQVEVDGKRINRFEQSPPF